MQPPEFDRGAHDAMAEGGDTPAPGARDLRHEPVDVEPGQEVAVSLSRRSRLVKPCTACSPLMRAVNSWESGRATGLKALAGRLDAESLGVVMASRLRRPGVGSSTCANALRYRELLCKESSR